MSANAAELARYRQVWVTENLIERNGRVSKERRQEFIAVAQQQARIVDELLGQWPLLPGDMERIQQAVEVLRGMLYRLDWTLLQEHPLPVQQNGSNGATRIARRESAQAEWPFGD